MNPGMNWHAFKIDVDIATMDSLNKEAKSILDLISTIYPAAKQYEHFSVNLPPQQNAVDCGPCSCCFWPRMTLTLLLHWIMIHLGLRLTCDCAFLRTLPKVNSRQLFKTDDTIHNYGGYRVHVMVWGGFYSYTTMRAMQPELRNPLENHRRVRSGESGVACPRRNSV